MDKELLASSLGLVADSEEGLTPRFYSILFERYPAVRPMFSADVATQAGMLREAVVAVVDHLDDAPWLQSTLGSLGAKHAGYGVTPEMYGAVKECMLAAMAELGGDAWTAELTIAWDEALAAVAGLMLAGAEAPTAQD